jgi:hypothetical protein
MRRLAVANFPDSSILDLPERGAGAREPGHQRTCRNVESAGSLGKGQPLDGDEMKRGALLFRQVHECAPNLGETQLMVLNGSEKRLLQFRYLGDALSFGLPRPTSVDEDVVQD